MELNRTIHIGKKWSISLTLLFIGTLNFACKGEVKLPEDDKIKNEDCFYKFGQGLDNIHGNWEPKVIIDDETGDSTFYEIGEGHTGFMLEQWYADAFEIRDNNEFDIYYVTSGKPCKSRANGTWSFENMMLTFLMLGDTVQIPVLKLAEDELIIEDIINFKESKAIMRKVTY